MSEGEPSKAGQPALVETGPEERMTIVDGVRECMKQSSLSFLEEYVMQKAIALFLLGERVDWSRLYNRVASDGLVELPTLNISDEEDENEVKQAMNSLERKGLLAFEQGEEATLRIGAMRQGQSVLVRSVYHFERKHTQG